MQKIGFHLPINSVSFGQISTLILRTLYERDKESKLDLDICLFPIGQPDLSSQKEDKEFAAWIQQKLIKGVESWDRNTPLFKLWHLNGSLESFSNKQTLLSFYELDRPTKVEVNVARNTKLCFTSEYTCDVFKTFGVDCKYIPAAFDSYNFSRLDKKFHVDNRIVFNLTGKLEKRKGHKQIIQAWIKKFGNDPKYVLQCAIYNPFLIQQTPQGPQDLNNHFIGQIVGNNKPFNVVFYPQMAQNNVYNEFLNSASIIIGMSGGEGWGLPEFQSIAIGKHGVILNAHSYKSWATNDNAVLVNPNGKEDSADGHFFRQGDVWNQGSIFTWNDEEFIVGCESAIKRVQSNPINTEGLKLQEQFNKDKFVDSILKYTLEYYGFDFSI